MIIKMDISQLFNQSLEMGKVFNGVTTDVTGSWTITFLLTILLFIMIAGFFKMPEVLYVIPIIPLVLLFSLVDPTMKIILGIISLFLAYVIYSLMPVR